MKVEVKLDPNYTETKIKIYTNEINEEISSLMKQLEVKTDNKIIVWQKEKIYIHLTTAL